MKKILVPVDFSQHSELALNYAVLLAKQAKSEIIVVHVCAPNLTEFKDHDTIWSDSYGTILTNTNQRMELIRNSIRDTENLEIRTEILEGLMIDTIIEAIKKFEIDLVVMGTLGESGVRERIFGSKTAALIGRSEVPVLAIPFLSTGMPPKNMLLVIDILDDITGHTDMAIRLAALFKTWIHVLLLAETEESTIEEKIKIDLIEDRIRKKYSNFSFSKYNVLNPSRLEENIEELVEEYGIDIVSLTTHHRGFFSGLFHKDLAKKMSYHINVPLLVLPDKISKDKK